MLDFVYDVIVGVGFDIGVMYEVLFYGLFERFSDVFWYYGYRVFCEVYISFDKI